jgi:hypothetical protein
MNEFLLRKAHVLRDVSKLVIAVANYAFKSLFTTRIPHLEGERCLVLPSAVLTFLRGR